MTSKDSTFTRLTSEQATAYAASRGLSYPKVLYDRIQGYHAGAYHAVLDVGTGPGQVVFDLLDRFDNVFGCDAGHEMTEQAKRTATKLAVTERAKFTLCSAENCADAFPGQKFDLITAAMAVHWFDLPAFYASAAKALNTGGTLAVWTCVSSYVHPSAPNHEELQHILTDLEDRLLRAYGTPGNFLTMNAYEPLSMPWDFAETAELFDRSSFQRQDWDRHGIPSASALADGSPGPYVMVKEAATINQFLTAVGSSSSLIRWKEDNPADIGTDKDPTEIARSKLKAALGGSDKIYISPSLSLLLLRRA